MKTAESIMKLGFTEEVAKILADSHAASATDDEPLAPDALDALRDSTDVVDHLTIAAEEMRKDAENFDEVEVDAETVRDLLVRARREIVKMRGGEELACRAMREGIEKIDRLSRVNHALASDMVDMIDAVSGDDGTRMTWSDYQREAARTGGSDLRPENRDKGLNCAAMGLAGESGEVCDLVKKVQHHRQPLDETKLKKELGDVLWYIAHACNVMGWTMEDIARTNVEKLRARYPQGFTPEDSALRRDEASVAQNFDANGAAVADPSAPESAR
jgi:NTP pyrophosphatase (non-canonical NTP hydrolase)